jgi:hypothetical protein
VAKRLVLLDFRLTGMVTDGIGEIIHVGGGTDIQKAFNKIATKARAVGGLDDLLICCHGFEEILEDYDNSISFMSGGYGLQLCNENLTLANVGVTGVLKSAPPLVPTVKRIVVFSCAAADTSRAAKNVGSEGKRLMGSLALTTGARVVASDATQYYRAIPSIAQSLRSAGGENDWRIDFGEWEGNVFEFSPDDGIGRKLRPDQHPHFDF